MQEHFGFIWENFEAIYTENSMLWIKVSLNYDSVEGSICQCGLDY